VSYLESDPLAHGAAEQAALVREGRVAAPRLAATAAERAAPHVTPRPEAAGEAEAIEAGDRRPLAGVPVVALEDWGPAAERLRDAGAIVIGTVPDAGRAAAAVAAGAVTLAHARDTEGEIRLAAAGAGLAGLKPSRFRVPMAAAPGLRAAIAVDGVLSRGVHDAALALDVMTGDTASGPLAPPPPTVPFADAALTAPVPLRIRVTGEGVEPVARLLASLGHEVLDGAPDWADDALAGQAAALDDPRSEAAASELFKAYTRRVIGSWPPGSVLLSPIGPEYTLPFNVTGQPALALGAVQLAAPVGREARLLSLAAQIELAMRAHRAG